VDRAADWTIRTMKGADRRGDVRDVKRVTLIGECW
jgi:hypothetical protein